MCAQRRDQPDKSSGRGGLPWIGAGVGALLLAGGVIWWGLERPPRADAKSGLNDPAMVRLLEESRELEREFARIRQNRTPAEADLVLLQQSIAKQREWMEATGSTEAEQQQRLRELEALHDDAWQRSTIARSAAAEAEGRALLAGGKKTDAVAPLRRALDLQRLLNQRAEGGSGRDLPRETMLAQEIERLEAEPIAVELAAATAEAERLRDADRTAEALAAYHRAHELQLRLNREFARTQLASLGNLEKLETEIATLESVPLLREVMDLSSRAAEAQGRGASPEAVALFAQAGLAQQKLNRDFPRSRHVSAERIEALEVARQTELSAEPARRVAQLEREVAAKLRAGDPAGVPELLREGAELQDAMAARLPRSRRLDPELRLKFNYLYLNRDALEPVLRVVAGQFRPVPGGGGQMLRTEVPQRLYTLVMRTNPSRQAGDDLPVESVSLPEAAEFCRRLSWLLGRTVRLPTEAEYRAALGTAPQGESLLAAVWSQERSDDRPQPVGAAVANAAGFHDLLGNVAEWLSPASADAEATQVAGGSYAEPAAGLAQVPLVTRQGLERARTIGFRVVVE